jgi:glycosyltransferase involved in cell wall biosynthesis
MSCARAQCAWMPRIRSETAAAPTLGRHRGPANVLYVDSAPYLGGAEISLLLLMESLDRERYIPGLVTSAEGELAGRARDLGVEVHIQDFPWLSRRRPWVYTGTIWRLWSTLRRQRISLVHSNCPRSLHHVRRACQWARVPYVSHVRDFRDDWFQAGRLALLNRAERIIANSQATAAAFVKGGVEEARVCVIYNPFDTARFVEEPAVSGSSLRCDLGIPPDAFVVGIVGQIQAMKGHEELMRAVPQVLAQVSDAYFVVAGGAFTDECRNFQSHLRRLVDELGIADRFRFIGFRQDVPAVLKALDVLAVPSWREPFGRVVVEGLAAGCPVVGTRSGGIPEIVEDGINGLLVPPKDVDLLATALIRLAQDGDLRARFSAAGPETARRFGVKLHVDRIQELYDSVLAEGRQGLP